MADFFKKTHSSVVVVVRQLGQVLLVEFWRLAGGAERQCNGSFLRLFRPEKQQSSQCHKVFLEKTYISSFTLWLEQLE